jgi:hypothetical protein
LRRPVPFSECDGAVVCLTSAGAIRENDAESSRNDVRIVRSSRLRVATVVINGLLNEGGRIP